MSTLTVCNVATGRTGPVIGIDACLVGKAAKASLTLSTPEVSEWIPCHTNIITYVTPDSADITTSPRNHRRRSHWAGVIN
jgi:hypothetical protein